MGYPASLTDQEIAHIKERYLAGHTADLIAYDMGVTKGKVIGKIWRMELKRAANVAIIGLKKQTAPLAKFHRGPAPEWGSPEADEILRILWNGGVALLEIAAFWGVDRHAIQRRRQASGLEQRGAHGVILLSVDSLKWRSPEADAAMTRMWNDGDAASIIQARFKIRRSTLTTRRVELGLKPRGTGGARYHASTSPKAPVIAREAKAPPKQIAMDSAGRGVSTLRGVQWSAKSLPMPVVRPGLCGWASACDQPGVPFCEYHAGLLGRSVAA